MDVICRAENRSSRVPLSSHNCFSSTDLEETHNRLSQTLMPHRIAPRGAKATVSSFINQADLGHLTFSVMRFGSAVSVSPGALRDFYVIHLPIVGGVSAVIDGKSYAAGEGAGLALSPDVPLELEWAEGSIQLLVRIPKARLEGHLHGLTGGGSRTPLVFAPTIDLTTEPGRACAALIEFLVDGLDRDAFQIGTLADDLERSLLSTILSDIPNSYTDVIKAGSSPKPYYVHRAEQFMLKNLEEDISIIDLARAAGVSERTLHAGFRRFSNTTPLRRLQALRLERVHNTLLRSRPGEIRISDIASRYCMYQFGQFSGLYKARYGVSPSETLKRI